MILPMTILADDDFIAEQRDDFDTLSPEDIIKTRQDLVKMAEETLQRLYKEQPKAKDEIKNAYGYGVFKGQAVNLIMYVAGKGLGVVYDNKTKTPIFMKAIRAGTGPGVGYKSMHGVLIFANEIVYKQFTTIGLQVSASGDAQLKVAGKGAGTSSAVSLVPGVSLYQLVDTGLVLQANWGATEFLKDPHLNKK
jgi:lipid-binding SYLF domain-containing protein